MSQFASLPPSRPWKLPARHGLMFYVAIIAIVAISIIAFVVTIPLLTEAEGGRIAATAGLLALVPVVVVTALVFWVDSWEPEPRWLMFAMFAWGGGIAVLGALFFNTMWAEAIYDRSGNAYHAEIWGAVVSAPIVEEAVKGLGVVLAFVIFRKYFNGPIDGICYGAMSGLGFAFTENILYFTRFWDDIGVTYVARAVTSPLLHPISTAMMGLMLGFAVYRKNRATAIPFFLMGYIAGVIIHAMHNGAAVVGQFHSLVIAFQIPSYLAALVIVLWLRHDEVTVIKYRLGEYMRAGWFAPYEVEMLTSVGGRREARTWAKNRGRLKEMKRFQAEAAHLALNRQRAATGAVSVPRARRIEASSLASISATRRAYSQ